MKTEKVITINGQKCKVKDLSPEVRSKLNISYVEDKSEKEKTIKTERIDYKESESVKFNYRKPVYSESGKRQKYKDKEKNRNNSFLCDLVSGIGKALSQLFG